MLIFLHWTFVCGELAVGAMKIVQLAEDPEVIVILDLSCCVDFVHIASLIIC